MQFEKILSLYFVYKLLCPAWYIFKCCLHGIVYLCLVKFMHSSIINQASHPRFIMSLLCSYHTLLVGIPDKHLYVFK